MRIHVVVIKEGDAIRFDFSGSADQTEGPANVRPPLVEAACAYCLISLIDPHIHICSGLFAGFRDRSRGAACSIPRFPAPVNTYNPTVHALIDAMFAALSHIAIATSRADGSGSRSILLGGRHTRAGGSYVQYEIIAGGSGGRAGKDGASGITVNQSNARIAPVEIIESEFPTRLLRFEPIRDFRRRRPLPRRPRHSARISQPRGRALLHPLNEARDRAERLCRRRGRPTGDILINPDSAGEAAGCRRVMPIIPSKRRYLPPRHARWRRLRPALRAGFGKSGFRCGRGLYHQRRRGT